MSRDYKSILPTVIGPYDNFCSGNTFGDGNGYIVAPAIGSSTIKMNCSHAGSQLLDETVAFDKAEASGANLTQTNMIQVSSFCGIRGLILGYDILVSDHQPHQELQQYRGIPIFDMESLTKATSALFGTIDNKNFPIAPGEHVPCAYKTLKHRGKLTIYGALALGIADNRSENADLFMEDLGIVVSDDEEERKTILENLAKSVIEVANNLKTSFQKIFLSIVTQKIDDDEIGCIITAAPYIRLAKNAIPGGIPQKLEQMSLSVWMDSTKNNPELAICELFIFK